MPPTKLLPFEIGNNNKMGWQPTCQSTLAFKSPTIHFFLHMNSHMMTNNAYLTEFHTLKPGLEC
jgi:hypothetical protein